MCVCGSNPSARLNGFDAASTMRHTQLRAVNRAAVCRRRPAPVRVADVWQALREADHLGQRARASGFVPSVDCSISLLIDPRRSDQVHPRTKLFVLPLSFLCLRHACCIHLASALPAWSVVCLCCGFRKQCALHGPGGCVGARRRCRWVWGCQCRYSCVFVHVAWVCSAKSACIACTARPRERDCLPLPGADLHCQCATVGAGACAGACAGGPVPPTPHPPTH